MIEMLLTRLNVLLLRLQHERPVHHWLSTRAQYRLDHEGWL